MPNYTGDPAAADAPDAAPDPENFPIQDLPADTETLNAASVQQAFKSVNNHLSWLKKAIAKASAWIQNLRTYRDARGRRRFKLDHFGLPHGALYEWSEQWTPLIDYELAGPLTAQAAGRWGANLDNAATFSTSSYPGIVVGANMSDTARALLITLDGSGVSNANWWRLDPQNLTSVFTANSLVRCTFDFTPLNVTGTVWRLGFIMAGGQAIDAIANGVYFTRPDTPGTNWLCHTVDGGAPTSTDSGVAGTASARHVFEIYLVGSGVGDDSTNRALFIIDGVLVANHTANLPITTTTNQCAPAFGGVSTGGGATLTKALVGQIKYAQITDLATL